MDIGRQAIAAPATRAYAERTGMKELAKRECVLSDSTSQQLPAPEQNRLLQRLPGWQSTAERRLQTTFSFGNFSEALAFVNRVGALAEEQNHHPELWLKWGEVRIQIWTHTVDGLMESDFVFAAKTQRLYETR